MRRRAGWIGVLGGAATAVMVLYSLPAGAQGAGAYVQENLVSDQPGVAQLQDAQLVNAWGMSRGPNTPLWVSDNGADVTTLYTGAVGNPETPVVKNPNVHPAVAGGAPTGQVFNDVQVTNPNDFLVPGTTTPAAFMFASENGVLSAWAGAAATTQTAATPGAVYKGLALVHSPSGPLLLAANFHDNSVDVFNGQFARVTGAGFTDPGLPRDYAPFNVAEINGQVFVTYAKQDADRHDDVAGPAHGFIDVFSTSGALVKRFATHGVLNSPWGMTIAPPTFGKFGGDLLVGNFGDGRIHAFDPQSGEVLGILRGTSGKPLAIDGLWGLIVGDAVAGGPDAVWFSAGPDGEAHGLLGILRPAS
jgi:uncharacterized protein (TIGR03118 family)